MIRFLPVSVAIAILAAACDRTPQSSATDSDATKPVQTGVASMYSRASAGRQTASGETLKPDQMTAASRTLPLGARVETRNLTADQNCMARWD